MFSSPYPHAACSAANAAVSAPRGRRGAAVSPPTARNGSAALLMGFIVWLWGTRAEVWLPTGSAGVWLVVLGGALLALAVYIGAAFALRSRELTPVLRLVAGKLRR